MAIQYDFEASVGYWATITSIAFCRALNQELAPLGITQRQSQVLACLVQQGTLSQCELADCLDIEAPTLAGIISRMEAAGWVKRNSCSKDRRKKLVQIDATAEPVWEQIAACARKVRAAATQGLTTEEIETLRSLLRRVHDNLHQSGLMTGQARNDCRSANNSVDRPS